jgi:hypothetical protein
MNRQSVQLASSYPLIALLPGFVPRLFIHTPVVVDYCSMRFSFIDPGSRSTGSQFSLIFQPPPSSGPFTPQA